jgi:hypothetical protein
MLKMASVAFVLTIQASVFAIVVLFIWLIARRRANWARWALLIMFLAGMVFYIPTLGQMLRTSPLSAILSIIQYFIEGLALYLVFTGNAVAWFRAQPAKMPSK